MNLLSKNMRRFRKEKGMTQNQLAEALDVSVGVISKWELELSSPDIETIVAMAELFGVSIDVLVGYELSYKSIQNYKDQIEHLFEVRAFADCLNVSESALKKYPNDYMLVCLCARIYQNVGAAKHSKKHQKHALDLYERALVLHDPSKHDVSDLTKIRDSIARIHIALENVDSALDYLISNNINGANDDVIGYLLSAKKHASSEAFGYLDKGFISNIDSMFRLCVAYSIAFCDSGEYEQAISTLLWLQTFMDSVKKDNKSCFIDKSCVLILCEMAHVYIKQQKMQEAKEALQDAVNRAVLFDENPSYELKGLILIKEDQLHPVFDDFGETAMDGIDHFVQERDASTNGSLNSIVSEIKHQYWLDKKTKKRG